MVVTFDFGKSKRGHVDSNSLGTLTNSTLELEYSYLVLEYDYLLKQTIRRLVLRVAIIFLLEICAQKKHKAG